MALKRINLVIKTCNLNLVMGEVAVDSSGASVYMFTHTSVKPLMI